MSTRIMFAGGGTGGHIYPLQAIAEELTGSDCRFVGQEEVSIARWRVRLPLRMVQDFARVWAYMPDMIITTGGYAAFFTLLAGRLFFIPIIVCDLDSVPGRVNHLFGKRARQVFVAYDRVALEYPSERVSVVGYPIRRDVLQRFEKAESVKWFGFDGSKPVAFITTANQGSKPINDIAMLALFELTKRYHVIHQAGSKQYDAVAAESKEIIKNTNDYKLFSVMSAQEMALAYDACDVVVSRAGTVLFEIAAAGKPAVVIPFPDSSGGHQETNAQEFAQFGAIVIEQTNLTEHVFLREIVLAIEKKDELGKKIAGFAKPNAASTIAQYITSSFS